MKENAPRAVLKMERVSKDYEGDGAGRFQALRDISFEVRKGEFVAIVGPSGSGKSTLLHLLGCLDKPTSGTVFIDGIAVSALNDDSLAQIRSDKIGFVFQAFNLAPTLNVFKNVELPLIIRGTGAEERADSVARLLGLVGLSDKANNLPSELSGGEKQRVAIARALANEPSILLADEPTGNLDSRSGKGVMELFAKLWEQGMTIILITHEPQVAAYGSRMLSLRDGCIEQDARQKPRKAEGEKLKLKQ